MKRLFLASYGIIILTFFIVFIGLEQLDLYPGLSDEDAERQEIIASLVVLEEIAEVKGQARAEEVLEGWLSASYIKLEKFPLDSPNLPEGLAETLQQETAVVESVDTYSSYFTFGDKQAIYRIEADMLSDVWEAEQTEIMVFFAEIFVALAAITIILLYLLSLRLKRFETTCIAFAEGDFDARASTKSPHKIGKLNITFNQMAEKISSLITSNRSLTNAVAHEFRTPIFRVQCNLDMLDDSGVRPEQMPYLEGIQEDLDELNTMVEELLHFSKLKRLDKQLDVIKTPVLHLIEKQLAHLQFETEIKLHLTSTQEVECDIEVRSIQRALGNIIRNGYKYAQSTVQISISDHNKFVLIQIENDGPAIDEIDRERVFDPFTRLDKSRDRQSGGHGLGLAITKQIIKQHGGDIKITDSHLGGPNFNITLPKSATD